jgi:hypothetical protein
MHAKIARANVAHAGLADRVDMRLGKALDSLPTLAGEGPFDFRGPSELGQLFSVGSQALASG